MKDSASRRSPRVRGQDRSRSSDDSSTIDGRTDATAPLARPSETPADSEHLLGIPERLRPLINPEVLAERRQVIQERFRERQGDSWFRRRYIEVIARHLLSTIEQTRTAKETREQNPAAPDFSE